MQTNMAPQYDHMRWHWLLMKTGTQITTIQTKFFVFIVLDSNSLEVRVKNVFPHSGSLSHANRKMFFRASEPWPVGCISFQALWNRGSVLEFRALVSLSHSLRLSSLSNVSSVILPFLKSVILSFKALIFCAVESSLSFTVCFLSLFWLLFFCVSV